MWQLVQVNSSHELANTAPSARTKHAVCFANDGHIYLFAGKCLNTPLKDLWRFDSEQNHWEEIKCEGESPPCLQNHSMNAWNDRLYVFGGEVGYNSADTPLWTLELSDCRWSKWRSVDAASPGTSDAQPNGRSGHSALIYNNKLYIYGGYQQLNGSLSDLWMFDLETEKWFFLNGPSTNGVRPAPRHLHSAVIHQQHMYVYGGMSSLQAKGDLWKWDLEKNGWSKVKCGKGPGELHGHSAIRVRDDMFIFGGEKSGQISSELWKFNFVSESWNKVHMESGSPTLTGGYVAIANPLLELAELCFDSPRTSDRSDESQRFENTSEVERFSKTNEVKSVKETVKCNCKSQSRSEGVFRKLFRKSIRKNKLIRSKSSSSNVAECDHCAKNAQMSDQIVLSESTKTEQSKSSVSNCQVNSCACSVIESRTSVEVQRPDKLPLPMSPVQRAAEQRFEIGRTDESGSCGEEEEELINRLSLLQKQLEVETFTESPLQSSEEAPLARFDPKKPRPKSELIAELISLEEDINDSWDGIDLKRHSVHESMSYYSLCFPSPNYTLPTKHKCATKTPTTMQVTPPPLIHSRRPHSYQPDGQLETPVTQPSPLDGDEGRKLNSIYSPSSVCSTTLESISNSMSQSSGYQSLIDECEPPPTLPIVERRDTAVSRRANALRTSRRYSRDCSGFDVRLLEHTSNVHWDEAGVFEPVGPLQRPMLPTSASCGIELGRTAPHVQMRMNRTRPLPRAHSFDKKLARSTLDVEPLWRQIHVIKEVIAPASPALQTRSTKSSKISFITRRKVKNREELTLCMFAFGGVPQSGSASGRQAICIWKLYA